MIKRKSSMSFATRLTWQPPTNFMIPSAMDRQSRERVRNFSAEEVRAFWLKLRNAVHVNIDEVACMLQEDDATWRKMANVHSFPNAAPPWPAFFFEWSDRLEETDPEPHVEVGMLWIATDAVGDFSATWQNPIAWILQGSLAVRFPERSSGFRGVGVLPVFAYVGVADDGSVVPLAGRSTAPSLLIGEKEFMGALEDNTNMLERTAVCVATCCLAIGFCHCKNVVRDPISPRMPAKWYRRTKTPVLKEYCLRIRPMRGILAANYGSGDGAGLDRAMHICRGHFAHYGTEAPLFGKYSGDFWVPQHIRGHADVGEIRKSYAISAR